MLLCYYLLSTYHIALTPNLIKTIAQGKQFLPSTSLARRCWCRSRAVCNVCVLCLDDVVVWTFSVSSPSRTHTPLSKRAACHK